MSDVDIESVARRLDRFAGGRHAAYRIDREKREDPQVRRSWTVLGWLIVLLVLLGGGAVGAALDITVTGGSVSRLVWWRLLVILAIATTLLYFRWRAQRGWWWAYSRLKLFSVVFPVIAIGTSLIPGLYPGWMVAEQIAFSSVLLCMFWLLSRPPLAAAYPKAG